MCTIMVDMDAVDITAPDIASRMGSPFYHETSFALLLGEVGESGSKEPGAYYQIVVCFHSGNGFACMGI